MFKQVHVTKHVFRDRLWQSQSVIICHKLDFHLKNHCFVALLNNHILFYQVAVIIQYPKLSSELTFEIPLHNFWTSLEDFWIVGALRPGGCGRLPKAPLGVRQPSTSTEAEPPQFHYFDVIAMKNHLVQTRCLMQTRTFVENLKNTWAFGSPKRWVRLCSHILPKVIQT